MIAETDAYDRLHMAAALGLARRGLGRVSPNPAVGCILVKPVPGNPHGRVVGRGWTQPGGRPHAETEALRRAGIDAQASTAYVTLEPCSHQGKTPPCADALIEAGIRRCVIACRDPDPRVSGGGIEKLKAAGIQVQTGMLADQAARLNEGFFLRIQQQRPLITLKAATSLDGRIATRIGDSQWITGELARSYGHLLRAQNDAILVGINTALKDDPSLTCRLAGLERQSPIRIVLDASLRLPTRSKLVTTAKAVPTWVLCREGASEDRARELADSGVVVIQLPADPEGLPDLEAGLRTLAQRGITRLLVEGGGTVAASFLAGEWVDHLVWFRAPMIIGGEGFPVSRDFGVDSLGLAALFTRVRWFEAGEDCVEYYRRRS